MLQTHRVRTLDQVRTFLDGAEPVELQPLDRSARYEFVDRTLRRFEYRQPGKADKGVVRRFVGKVSGLSRAQLTRLIAQHRSTGRLRDRRGPPRRPPFRLISGLERTTAGRGRAREPYHAELAPCRRGTRLTPIRTGGTRAARGRTFRPRERSVREPGRAWPPRTDQKRTLNAATAAWTGSPSTTIPA